MDITNLREQYKKGSLSKKDVLKDPIAQLVNWVNEAINAKVPEPNAMCLATVSEKGKPSARIVLLKEISATGIIFYTNYESRKGREIASNNDVAIVFNWLELQRQVRIEGTAKRISDEKSSSYFQSRPKESQLGALVSHQSTVIENRTILEEKLDNLATLYKEQEMISKPDYWGGYHIEIESIEFWQGRQSRLHDRILFSGTDSGWSIDRLSP